MNKYAARGIMLDAIAGKSIVVLTVGVHEITHVLGELNEQLGHSTPARAKRGKDVASLKIEGAGSVHIQSWRTSLRGADFDAVYLDTGVDPEIRSIDKLDEIAAVVATATAGEIIRA